jgi:energy-converting hydrogenase Eha subunit A
VCGETEPQYQQPPQYEQPQYQPPVAPQYPPTPAAPQYEQAQYQQPYQQQYPPPQYPPQYQPPPQYEQSQYQYPPQYPQQPQHQPTGGKARHGFTTFCLILLTIACVGVFAISIILFATEDEIFLIFSPPTGLAALGLFMLLHWKKVGFWIVCLASGSAIVGIITFSIVDYREKEGIYLIVLLGLFLAGSVYGVLMLRGSNGKNTWEQLQQSPTLDVRHGFTTFWLVLLSVACGAFFVVCFIASITDEIFYLLFSLPAGLAALGLFMLLRWKKVGFWIVCLASVSSIVGIITVSIVDYIEEEAIYIIVLLSLFLAGSVYGVLRLRGSNGKNTWEQLQGRTKHER